MRGLSIQSSYQPAPESFHSYCFMFWWQDGWSSLSASVFLRVSMLFSFVYSSRWRLGELPSLKKKKDPMEQLIGTAWTLRERTSGKDLITRIRVACHQVDLVLLLSVHSLSLRVFARRRSFLFSWHYCLNFAF